MKQPICSGINSIIADEPNPVGERLIQPAEKIIKKLLLKTYGLVVNLAVQQVEGGVE
jgi:hypothetical protein